MFVLVLLVVFFFIPSANAEIALFQTYTQRDGLAADYVTGIAFAPDGAAWIASPRGVTRIRDQYWTTYTSANGLANSWVNGIAIASDGKPHLATYGGGLNLFDGAIRKTYDLANNYLTAIAIDKQKRVWVGTYGGGVARLENEAWTKYSLANNYINALALDANGNLWVATNDGAFFFDGKAFTSIKQANGLASNRVGAIAVAPDNRVWFGTDAGVTVYDGRAYRTYKKSDGLADDNVRALAIDATRVWVGTARGLSVFEAGKWKSYTQADGLADDQINALAIDAQNASRIWIGTSRGLSIFGGAKLQTATTLPVVLVHGWHTAESDELDDTEFRFIRKYLERDGFRVFYAQGISPYNTLFQNAAVLRDVIADAKAKTGVPRVDIIAFSMGGLNTRAYIESTLYQNDVRRAIILGTPQAGVQMWYPLLTREIQNRLDEPSVIELTPEYATLFNRTHQPRATVPYDLLIGDARAQSSLELLKVFPPSDGLIDVFSAHALAGPQVRRIVNSDLHDWQPAPLPFNLTGYLYPESTYQQFIRNALRDPDTRPIGLTAAPVDSLAPRNHTPLNVDTLNAGATITRTILIDANRAARFIARWDRGDVSVTLRAPDGTTYTPDNVRESIASNEVNLNRIGKTNLLDATYLKADIGSFIGYSISRAQTGTWSLIATRLDKDREPMQLTTYADLDSDLRLNVKTDRAWYLPGTPVILEASITSRDANADVRAQIEWLGDGATPRGKPIDTILLQEGAPGFFADAITGLTRGGYYLARIVARGNDYARERQLLFAISPQTAVFVADATTRADKNALTINVAVNVKRAGDFAIGATVKSARGQLVTSLTAPFVWQAGAQNVSIAIPGSEIRVRGIDGPYLIELVLMDAAWTAVQVDELTKSIITAPHRASDFGE